MSVFLDNPHKDFHVREIARLVNKSPTTASSELNKLRKKGLLSAKKERNHLLYQAIPQNKNYQHLKLFHNIKSIRDSGLIEYLIEFYNHPSAIIIFGSFRKAENIPSSDIDLFILSSKKEEPKLEKFEKELKHKIQLFTFSPKKLHELRKNNPHLLNNVINGIVLEGFIEVF